VPNEFLKSLISLLAASGGSASLPLSDLSQLGIELSLSDLGSDSCTLRLRLGPKIYYVPEKGAVAPVEAPCPTTPATTSPAPATPPSPSTLDAEILAVNSLNNRATRPARPARPPRFVPPEEQPPSLPSVVMSSAETEAQRQESLTLPSRPDPSSSPPARRVVPKSDIDLFMAEQRQQKQKSLAQAKRDREILRQGKEYPWETRKLPPPKLQ